jgi:hypothetical protein
MSDLIRLSLTTVNAPDAIALARFYAEITGGVAKGDEYWALVEGPNGDLGFQQIDDCRPPTWPDGEVDADAPRVLRRRPGGDRSAWRPSGSRPDPASVARPQSGGCGRMGGRRRQS